MGGQFRGFRVLMSFSFRAAPREATLFLFFGVLMSLTAPVMAYGSKLLVDAAVHRSAPGAVWAVLLLALVPCLLLVITLNYLDYLFSVAEKAGAEVDRRLIRLMGGVPGLAHHERPEYLDHLDLLREQRGYLGWMTNATAGMVRVAVQLTVSGILLARLDPILLLLPLAGFVSFAAGRKAQDLQQRAAEATAEWERLRRHLFDVATSAVAGKEIRVFGLEHELIRRHHQASADVIRVRDRASWQSAALQAIDAVVSGVAYAGAIGLVLVHAVNGKATVGDVVLAIGLAAGMNAIVYTAVMYGTSFLRVLRVAQRYLWLEDYARETTKAPPSPAIVPQSIKDGIDVRSVSFSYPDMGRQVLHDVSLHMPAGAVIALVGENGAGKTTLVKLLSRFYDADSGTIEVDGTDLHRFDIERWRSRITAAFQDFARFQLLVRQVVGVGDLPRIEDRAALQTALARSGAESIPERLPHGLETQLGKDWEGGVDLSGGQWQKLALGRAMMRQDPLLLILDEPTASLDADTEHELFERYARAARETGTRSGTITLLVTHRFSTVRMADLIVVLEDGRIREMGSHDELMARQGSYAELYELQARSYR